MAVSFLFNSINYFCVETTFRARQASPQSLGSDYMHGSPQDSLRDSFFTQDVYVTISSRQVLQSNLILDFKFLNFVYFFYILVHKLFTIALLLL